MALILSNGDEISFNVPRRYWSQWEHVVRDAVTLHMIEMKITFGVSKCPAAMGETMQTVFAIVPIVPIVEKIIMKQSGTYQRTQIHLVPQMHSVRQPYGQAGHSNGMRVCGDHTVLIAGSFDLHVLMTKNVMTMDMYDSLYLRTRQHRFAFFLLFLLEQRFRSLVCRTVAG